MANKWNICKGKVAQSGYSVYLSTSVINKGILHA